MPAVRRDWEPFGIERSLGSITQAAHNLSTRYVPAADAIRSWDCLVQKDITVAKMENNLLTIIDSMYNFDLLFHASAQTGEQRLTDVAASHATLLKTHLRPESEGYAADSKWSRGQAWAILGYAQSYNWTKEERFLDAACGCAEYFLLRLETSPSCIELSVQSCPGNKSARRGRHVPLCDFDAPIENPREPLRDSSAGIIAAHRMLLLSQALAGLGRHTLSRHFFDTSIEIVKDTLDVYLATEKVKATTSNDGGKSIKVEDAVLGATFDARLKHRTLSNYETAMRRYSNHGLVYGDYYLVEFGNLLLSMGLVQIRALPARTIDAVDIILHSLILTIITILINICKISIT
ncbi:glucuronyl hydrolase [Fusarium mundagurra]|uniref:Glucuronyl hydrolase n=1 Tax=Fusarium mundagurra TaxID=1567541 RepID=A0A8H5Z5A9_9HYPO|nr:glucuronyl hydrolase [Fusarium mundagurra]